MADCDCSTTKFVCVNKNAYYFEGPQSTTENEPDTCIEEDRFGISQTHVELLRCHDNKFLTISYDGRFEKQILTAQDQGDSDNQFHLQVYNKISHQPTRTPVVLYAIKSGKKLVVCCNSSGEIHPEEMEIQNTIEDSKHKALFYMIKQDASNKYIFKSSLYEDKCLGFGPSEPNTSVVKLVLQNYDPDNHENEISTVSVDQ